MEKSVATLDRGATCSSWNYCGQRLASGTVDGDVAVFDTRDPAASSSLTCISKFKVHFDFCFSLLLPFHWCARNFKTSLNLNCIWSNLDYLFSLSRNWRCTSVYLSKQFFLWFSDFFFNLRYWVIVIQVNEAAILKIVWVPPEYGDAVACISTDGSLSLWEEVVEGIHFGLCVSGIIESENIFVTAECWIGFHH